MPLIIFSKLEYMKHTDRRRNREVDTNSENKNPSVI